MAFVAVDSDGTEIICDDPSREPMDDDGWCSPYYWDAYNRVEIPKGTIEKLIGRELTWSDEPVDLKD